MTRKSLMGVVNFLKPPGITSHDAVDMLRRALGMKKIGHTGTLDPAACGVLPLCVGKATRLAEFSTDQAKQYRAEMLLGMTTDTHDLSGDIVTQKDASYISENQIKESVNEFIGEIEQAAPAYSAVRYKGKRSYELARQGISVPSKVRRVKIFSLNIICIKRCENLTKVVFDVTCSKGTYIRSLCADIGNRLGTGGVLGFLVRTVSNSFLLKHARTIEEISEHVKNGDYNFILPAQKLTNHLVSLTLSEEEVETVKNGAFIDMQSKNLFSNAVEKGSFVNLVYDNQLVAIGAVSNEDVIRPKKVLI